jgi:squalene-hopene/tetraprenyl-beta-curcumene cyclase
VDPICDAVSSGIEIEGAPKFEFDGGRIMERARRYLTATQARDGSWLPLWFGNQDHPREENPVYGTAKVLKAYSELLMDMSWSLNDEGSPGDVAHVPEVVRGVDWLVKNQNKDGGWGSGVWQHRHRVTSNAPSAITSSVEETALAVEALISAFPLHPLLGTEDGPMGLYPSVAPAVVRGLNWLLDRVEAGQHRQPAPIGFYFAKLWYYERLYPLTFTVAALGRACRQLARPQQLDEQPHATRAT